MYLIWIVLGFAIPIAGWLIAFGVGSFRTWRRGVRRTAQTTGTVEHRGKGVPLVHFAVHDGTGSTHQFTHSSQWTYPRDTDQRVPILYEPRDPNNSSTDLRPPTFHRNLCLTLLGGGVAVLLLGAVGSADIALASHAASNYFEARRGGGPPPSRGMVGNAGAGSLEDQIRSSTSFHMGGMASGDGSGQTCVHGELRPQEVGVRLTLVKSAGRYVVSNAWLSDDHCD
jgi:hypothetical protein